MYKTILVHVDGGGRSASRIRVAAWLAGECDAHVIGSAVTGVSRDDFLADGGTFLLPPPDEDYNVLVESAHAALLPFIEQMGRHAVASWEQRIVEDSAQRALLVESRYADLMVLGRATPAAERRHKSADLPEYLALHCARPVLVVPDDYGFDQVGNTAMVGWDGSMEASRAITGALPLLRRARRVLVLLVHPRVAPLRHGEEPGADLALYLARHGIDVDVLRERADIDAGEALLAQAEAAGADLIVAGAYGHSRYREWFAGGATRTLLSRLPVPLLLAH